MRSLNFVSFMAAAVALAGISAASAQNIASHAQRSKVAGIDVVIYPMGVKDVVTIEGNLPAGDAFAAQGNVATATLTGMLLDRGTTKQDKFAIAKQLDDVGAQLGFEVGAQTMAVTGKSLKKDLPLVIRLMAEQLRTPAFSAEELAKAKKQLEGTLRPALEDVRFRSRDAFSRMVYPKGHANRMTELASWLTDLQKVSVDDVKAFHKRYYGPEHFTLVFVGDVDAKLIQGEINRAFAGWSGGVEASRAVSAGSADAQPEEKIALNDKTSIAVTLGQATGMRYSDEDSVALRVGTAILGSGFTGRLMHTLRDKEGLTYGIGASVMEDTFVDGSWAVSGAFAPTLVDQGIASARREVERWWQDGVTSQELEARKTNMIGTYQVGLSTTEGMAGAMLQAVNRGKPLSWLDDYPKTVAALSVAQVNAAIRKHLDPKKMVIVAAGTFAKPQPVK